MFSIVKCDVNFSYTVNACFVRELDLAGKGALSDLSCLCEKVIQSCNASSNAPPRVLGFGLWSLEHLDFFFLLKGLQL